jgi:hypothetical protein
VILRSEAAKNLTICGQVLCYTNSEILRFAQNDKATILAFVDR